MSDSTATPQHLAAADDVRIEVEDDRTGMSPVTLERAILDHLNYTVLKDTRSATVFDVYTAVAHAVRDRLVQRWIRTQRTYYEQDAKRVYYLSAEFLMGRALGNNLLNLGLWDTVAELLDSHGLQLEHLLEQEHDPGLGNGGLGRLAACFLDSMATLGIPGVGYGIRYEFGIFEQHFKDGWQVEQADAWLRYGYPWEVVRPAYAVPVQLYGRVESTHDERGHYRATWVDTEKLLGIPYDIPVAGYGNNTVNTLRLWRARATSDFNLSVFNDGDYRRAVEQKADGETVSKVLYPDDRSLEGRELRLKQQYFFTCCSIADILRRYLKHHDSFDALSDKVAIQLNDTHPAIAVAELMRVLVDQHQVRWERAWELTRNTIAYTNHTLLPEALEKWPRALLGRLLPRHLEIIEEIDRRFQREVQIFAPMDTERLRRVAIVSGGNEPLVHMAHLAVVGSHSVNGVAALHSELLKNNLLRDFAQMWPQKFNNKTNGVTPRRWLMLANPRLSKAISQRIGERWVSHLEELKALEAFADDATFCDELRAIKQANKADLCRLIYDRHHIEVSPDSIFDVQIKRLHEYKRQLLNCLHIIAHYQHIKEKPDAHIVPRTFIFGGKAAPGYTTAKLHIKLINDVAATINADPAMHGKLRVVFLANYGVSLAQRIIPATDVSEQISMAGKEASGTGNMKFAMNGALTIGTLDGANIEIREAVGAENFFLFGLNAEEVRAQKTAGYNPARFIENSERLKSVLELIGSGFFSPDDRARFNPILHDLWNHDGYLVCADFDAYCEAQQQVARAYEDRTKWTTMVVHNLANVGRFSSDRTIAQYAADIWDAKSIPVSLHGE